MKEAKATIVAKPSGLVDTEGAPIVSPEAARQVQRGPVTEFVEARGQGNAIYAEICFARFPLWELVRLLRGWRLQMRARIVVDGRGVPSIEGVGRRTITRKALDQMLEERF